MASSWQTIQDKDEKGRSRCYIVRTDDRYERPMRVASFHSMVPHEVAADVMRLLEELLDARLGRKR